MGLTTFQAKLYIDCPQRHSAEEDDMSDILKQISKDKLTTKLAEDVLEANSTYKKWC